MLITEGPFTGLQRNHYAVIEADPPWAFKARSDKGDGRSAKRHYPTMSLAQIKALPVGELRAKNSILLLWTTDTHLEQSLEVARAWGFKFKTVGFYWAKTNKDDSPFCGMGFWTRANPEQQLLCIGEDEDPKQCLLASYGAPKRVARDVRKLIVAPRREHSRKPDERYERIEALVRGPYLELFARSQRPGWTSWGNETDKFGPGYGADVEDLL